MVAGEGGQRWRTGEAEQPLSMRDGSGAKPSSFDKAKIEQGAKEPITHGDKEEANASAIRRDG